MVLHMFFSIIFFWISFSIIVAVAANTRGRSGFGWFLLALLISPLISGLLVLALPRVQRVPEVRLSRPTHSIQSENQIPTPSQGSNHSEKVFVPDGVFAGIPYKAIDGGAVIAMLPGGLVHFRTMELFVAAATGGDAEQ
jgi:hypothetical protein